MIDNRIKESVLYREALAIGHPWSIAFVIGWLHGFGFAGALGEIGLPQHAIPLVLPFFNIGVELGQLAFVGITLGLISITSHWHVQNIPVSMWTRLGPVYAIGTVAALWFIERLNGFL